MRVGGSDWRHLTRVCFLYEQEQARRLPLLEKAIAEGLHHPVHLLWARKYLCHSRTLRGVCDRREHVPMKLHARVLTDS